MRKTLQDLGIHDFFYHPRGPYNAITDVKGITVGHSTIIEGDTARTGVSVVIPEGLDNCRYSAGGLAYNANGEMVGLQYILEEGRLVSPIFLTNTLSVGDVFSAIVDYYDTDVSLPVIGECWDGYLNDIAGRHVKSKHVAESIESAKTGAIEQGNIGAGTGMTSFGYKAGIGTASRRLTILDQEYTVGVFVNNNLGSEDGRHRYLRIGGVDVAKVLGEYEDEYENGKKIASSTGLEQTSSSILVIATDVPMQHHQLNRLARHAVLGLGRVGIVSYTGSGDFILTFSTATKLPLRDIRIINNTPWVQGILLDELFEATIEAVEEAYLNSILTAEDMKGYKGHFMKALPIDKLLPHLR